MMKFNADIDRCTKLISSVRQSTRLLQELAGFGWEAFQSDIHKQSSAKYNFIVAIESAIDLANHIISRNKLRAPENYGDTFAILGENGFFPEAFVSEMVQMARFRNRLVHLYWDVDTRQLFSILETHLGDFDTFVSAIVRCIDGHNSHTHIDKS